MNRPALAPALIVATSLVVAGCSTATESGSAGADVEILASFYPLQYVAERVGGHHVRVDNLTPPAADPHDLELSPVQARAISEVDLVIHQSGLQPAVDEGIEARSPEHVVDAAAFADLSGTDDHDAQDAQDAQDDHDHGQIDPHFWLDPSRMAALGKTVADELAVVDPEHADDYAAGAAQFGRSMEVLDQEFADGLAACEGATLVTSHAAFGYLASRYSLDQVGIASFNPEEDPSPARLREVRDVAEAAGVSTIFTETLVSPEVAETLANDLGLETATLDPLEGLSQHALDSGDDYESVMRQNLVALTDGLECR